MVLFFVWVFFSVVVIGGNLFGMCVWVVEKCGGDNIFIGSYWLKDIEGDRCMFLFFIF